MYYNQHTETMRMGALKFVWSNNVSMSYQVSCYATRQVTLNELEKEDGVEFFDVISINTDAMKHVFKHQSKINDVLIHTNQLTDHHCLFTSSFLASIFVLLTTVAPSDTTDVTAQSFSSNEMEVFELVNKGIEFHELGDYEAAIRMYDRALTISPDDTFALLNKDIALDRIKDYEALNQYDKTLSMEPNNLNALVERGKVLYRIGNYSDAIDSFDRALIMNPNDTSILGMKRSSLIMNDTRDQREVDDLVSKGIDASYFGNYTRAIEYFDKALAINASDTGALSQKAITLSELLGNHTGALYYYEKIQEITNDEYRGLSGIGTALAGLGNYSGALYYYDKALDVNPYDPSAKDGKAAVLSIFNLIDETNKRQNITSGITSNITEESKAPDLRLGTHLLKETEANPWLEGAHKVDSKIGIYVIFGSNNIDNDIFKLQGSTPNLINLSDSQIGVDLAFSIPALPNSTIQSIERIKSLNDIRYIDTQPDYEKLIAFSDLPLTINNTQYSDLTIEVKKFNNGTGYLFIDGYK